ncbi:uncharacterized protein B4U79_16764 [Dinothrombium tinctorium]|uniref:Alpha-latrotoxin n=1 Tax=Dinothrombium tinctorium TaxID=1965070 RepID=A0A3S3P578_9ACAR|nr:uncharacterized protein B4U79_16764 [Dinothrombium tinctorium]
MIRSENNENIEYELNYRNYDLNEVDVRGYSPILLAANIGNRTLVKLLIKHGAAFSDEGRPEKVYCDPLHIAAKIGDLDVIKLLVKKAANVNALDSVGRTALWYALLGGHSIICRCLLLNGGRSRISYFEGYLRRNVKSISIRLSSAFLDSEEFYLKIRRDGEDLKYILLQKLIECHNPSSSTNFIEFFRALLYDEIQLYKQNEQFASTSTAFTHAFTLRKNEHAYDLIKHGVKVGKHFSQPFRFSSDALRPLQFLLDSNFLVDVSLYLEKASLLPLNDRNQNGQIELACYKHYSDENMHTDEVDQQYKRWFLELYEWMKHKLSPPFSLLHLSAAALRSRVAADSYEQFESMDLPESVKNIIFYRN